jgi:hypothetical protein
LYLKAVPSKTVEKQLFWERLTPKSVPDEIGLGPGDAGKEIAKVYSVRVAHAADHVLPPNDSAVQSSSSRIHLIPLTQLDHDIRYLDILFGAIFSRDLKDDILLMVRDGFARDGLNKIAQPIAIVVSKLFYRCKIEV